MTLPIGHENVLTISKKRAIRFWKKCKIKSFHPDECWECTLATDGSGYCQASLQGVFVKAHRLAFVIAYGEIDSGKVVCHKCDNPVCSRPSHLFQGAYLDNTQDAVSKKRMALGKRNGAYTKPHKVRVGILNGRAVLSEKQVIEIMDLWNGGVKNKYELARRYNVTDHAIRRIVTGVGWKNVLR